MRVLLDMDEVLTDFIGGACKLFGVSKWDLEQVWTPGQWDIVPYLEQLLGKPLDTEAFWEAIHRQGAGFWTSLEETAWCQSLVDEIGNFTHDWHIVTSPSHCPSSYAGKVEWIKRRFGRTFDRFAITPHKYIFARPDVLLIDDRASTIDKFRADGGRGIVFPAHHNWLFRLKDTPLEWVFMQVSKESGECILSHATSTVRFDC